MPLANILYVRLRYYAHAADQWLPLPHGSAKFAVTSFWERNKQSEAAFKSGKSTMKRDDPDLLYKVAKRIHQFTRVKICMATNWESISFTDQGHPVGL